MKQLLMFFVASMALGTAAAHSSVGLSIGINQPGVYGRINIGDLPSEALVMASPVVVAPPRVVVERRPIYLYVAPYEQAQWSRYCNRYAACGQPVYFVREDWVHERYVRDHPGWDRDHYWRGGPGGGRRFDGRGRFDDRVRDDHGRDDHGRDDHGRDDHGRDDHGRDDGHRRGPDRHD